jgi:hypothetical protein
MDAAPDIHARARPSEKREDWNEDDTQDDLSDAGAERDAAHGRDECEAK